MRYMVYSAHLTTGKLKDIIDRVDTITQPVEKFYFSDFFNTYIKQRKICVLHWQKRVSRQFFIQLCPVKIITTRSSNFLTFSSIFTGYSWIERLLGNKNKIRYFCQNIVLKNLTLDLAKDEMLLKSRGNNKMKLVNLDGRDMERSEFLQRKP